LRVRIPPRSQKTPEKQGFFDGKRNEPNLKYALGIPITIARLVQTEQCGWAKYALFGWNGRRNKELIGWSSSPKAVGSIKRAEQSGVTSSIFNCRDSVFFWHLLLLEQMTKEVPGVRPAVISIETGTSLDE